MSYQERQKEANKIWREKNSDFLKQYHREKYLKNRDTILQRAREKNKKKPKDSNKQVPAVVVVKYPKEYKLFEVLNILRKDLKHRLWGLCVKEWTDRDWAQFQQLKEQ